MTPTLDAQIAATERARDEATKRMNTKAFNAAVARLRDLRIRRMRRDRRNGAFKSGRA